RRGAPRRRASGGAGGRARVRGHGGADRDPGRRARRADGADRDGQRPGLERARLRGAPVSEANTSVRRAFSVAVYARRGDRVLVIEHRRLRTWLPIGGELVSDETPLEAAARELREETGLVGAFRPLRGALDGVP